jgi:ferric-dicitrate binding protein FerR (iron transport regulator)
VDLRSGDRRIAGRWPSSSSSSSSALGKRRAHAGRAAAAGSRSTGTVGGIDAEHMVVIAAAVHAMTGEQRIVHIEGGSPAFRMGCRRAPGASCLACPAPSSQTLSFADTNVARQDPHHGKASAASLSMAAQYERYRGGSQRGGQSALPETPAACGFPRRDPLPRRRRRLSAPAPAAAGAATGDVTSTLGGVLDSASRSVVGQTVSAGDTVADRRSDEDEDADDRHRFQERLRTLRSRRAIQSNRDSS